MYFLVSRDVGSVTKAGKRVSERRQIAWTGSAVPFVCRVKIQSLEDEAASSAGWRNILGTYGRSGEAPRFVSHWAFIDVTSSLCDF
jgi:hypothetical protein